MSDDVRQRILDGTIICLGRFGIDRTTVEDVSRESDVSRATIYRHFPDGKDEVIAAGIEHAVLVFFTEMADEIGDAADLAELLERGLVHGHRGVQEHEILRKVSETEPERLMPQLSRAATLIRVQIDAYLLLWLERETLAPGLDVESAARWLSRMILSFLFEEGVWDLSDPDQVRHLVRDELLLGILGDRPRGR